MKAGRLYLIALIPMLAVACSDGPERASTSDTTAALLSGPVGDGVSTPINGGSAAPDLPDVRVTDLGYNQGDSAAIVKVVELSDFGCGFCRRFHEETFPTILDEFIETGMVEWKFVPYVTGMFENSLAATEAGECVLEQSSDSYERLADRMWAEQSEWKGSGDVEPLLRGWVEALGGIDMDGFDGCLAENRRVQRIADATTLARQLGVKGTPTFVVVGYGPLQGALPTEFFQQILTAVYTEEAAQREGAGDTGN